MDELEAKANEGTCLVLDMGGPPLPMWQLGFFGRSNNKSGGHTFMAGWRATYTHDSGSRHDLDGYIELDPAAVMSSDYVLDVIRQCDEQMKAKIAEIELRQRQGELQ